MAGLENLLSVLSSLAILTLLGMAIYGLVVYGKKVKETADKVNQAANDVLDAKSDLKEAAAFAKGLFTEYAPKIEATVEDIENIAGSIECLGCSICKSKNALVQEFVKDVGLCGTGSSGCFDTTKCSASSAATAQPDSSGYHESTHRYGPPPTSSGIPQWADSTMPQ